MTIVVDVSLEDVRMPLSRARVSDLAADVARAEGVRDALLSFTFVRPVAMAGLNRRHLGHRGPTDVISFALRPDAPGQPVIGDVYICPDVARENARRHGGTMREELARLVVHGTLHVLGYDHPEGEGRTDSRMWRRQESLLERLYSARPR